MTTHKHALVLARALATIAALLPVCAVKAVARRAWKAVSK